MGTILTKKIEILLNSIIKMGWKPYGKIVDHISYIDSDYMFVCLNAAYGPIRQIKQDSLRELVSLESGLRQFVCENELVPYQTSGQIIKRYVKETVGRYSSDILEGEVISSDIDYQYRLLESALLPEEELEEFLLNNIIVEGMIN